MRTLVCILLAAAVIVGQAVDKERYVMPTQKHVGVYENRQRELNEKALYSVNANERLIVLADVGRNLKVKNTLGREGWVEKRLVAPIGASARMVFGDATVWGYLDNPTPIYVFGIDGSEESALRIDRSFRDELAINVDRETIERSAQ